MAITDTAIQVERTKSYAPNRVPTRRLIAIGATALVAAIVTMVAVAQNSGQESVRPTLQPAPQSQDDIVRDLVNRGLIPIQSLQPSPQSRDAIVRDLVDRGLVPAAALDD